jgi:hypothetical protein
MKDHEIAALVNNLRNTAIQYASTAQLRERIAHVVVPAIDAAKKEALLEAADVCGESRWTAVELRQMAEMLK